MAAICTPISAASYSISMGSSSDANGIRNVAGNAFRAGTLPGDTFTGALGGISAGPGVVAVGIFSTDTLTGLTASELNSAFTIFGTAGTYAASSGVGARSVFSLTPTSAVGATTFAGKSMYLFSGNGSTLANSTQFFALKTNFSFNANDDNNPNLIDVFMGFTGGLTLTSGSYGNQNGTLGTNGIAGGSVLLGSTVTNWPTTTADGGIVTPTTTPGFQMVSAAVPEPSAALLGTIGALGLLRRRRI